MNLMLITFNEFKTGISLNDTRAEHLVKILKLKDNDKFKFGILGEKNIYHCIYKKDKKLFFKKIFKVGESNKLKKLYVLIGMIRPIVAKRIIKELASIGTYKIIFFNTELTEKSYLNSKIFKNNDCEKHLIAGAMQGKITYLPKIKIIKNLKESLKYIQQENFEIKILLEKNSEKNLIDIEQINNAVIIVGPERGFTEKEKQLIAQYNFSPYSISTNTLRTETATIAASIITASKLINM
ncbi:ribosomal RNA small subunit methyltransferase E 1 [Borreliella burgdorferi]|uniref:Ribosomal RNA small subunit methyltransferase E 1 n=4 Tax=Borreliella burgdorferi TaxID=139 RepID=RSME1_BORBU|nr:16S rRNA (uracil(1498)-N(3))-methyltransferase [Borreliella burgdorferi]O51089.1 RecName: Full=Ribosomal RNA small subunit methyltransferase E 1; AltName: Full=16S rRNA m3U1498 methyltransferase 1 [Borreliella burgdorferi B31]AGS66087.1 16S ribosomal RNA methyltransferase RsmE [Borreliella burgdorferi CA382]AAC66455.1 RNA methyltransferase, RsmE family [Borreliella burgdorferi B31]ARS29853.1 ribosomal RNA small subunit methyltransferase E 1 [Borreliella burgdorferi]ARS31084.1 ribosomal RNA 